MRAIGIRELKEQASEILRRVREDGDSFEVTYHGKVIARLVPVTQTEHEIDLATYWDRMDELSRAVSAGWPAGVAAVDAVREGRRDL